MPTVRTIEGRRRSVSLQLIVGELTMIYLAKMKLPG